MSFCVMNWPMPRCLRCSYLEPDRFGAHHDPGGIALAVDHRDPDHANFIAESPERDVDDAVGDPVDPESSLCV
jgi:hypothetical protein